MRPTKLFALPMVCLAACTSLAPNYSRPMAPIPQSWSANPPLSTEPDQENELNTPAWDAFITSEELRQVVGLALRDSRDLRVSYLTMQQVRAQYRIARFGLVPDLNISASESANRTPSQVDTLQSGGVRRSFSAGVGIASYELDLFGRVQSESESALQAFFQSVENQRAARLGLVAEVCGAWLNLAADRQRLAIAEQTLESQERTWALVKLRHDEGIVSGLDLAQIEAALEAVRSDTAAYEQAVALDRHALDALVGSPVPESLLPHNLSEPSTQALPVARSLQSSVLLRRPDVLAAEHALRAANADIGAARAAFFPSISLTASTGSSSSELSGLFETGSRTWSFSPQISLPIFSGGRLKASLDVAKLQKDIGIAEYDRTIQRAFQEVSDALATREAASKQMVSQSNGVAASARANDLALERYNAGIEGFLQVLDSQRTLYAAQQTAIAVRLAAQINEVTLYQVLGGQASAEASTDSSGSL